MGGRRRGGSRSVRRSDYWRRCIREELLRKRVNHLSRNLRESVQSYGLIRRMLPPGERRTLVLDTIVESVRDRAAAGDFTSGEADRLAAGDEEMRAIALAAMQGDHKLINFDTLVRSIHGSWTGFEQYHALKLAREAWTKLPDDVRRDVVEAIERDRTGPNYIATDPDRAEIADDITRLHVGEGTASP